MTKVSELKLQWKRREGGGGCTQRDFLDFVVDGQPLSELVGDQASCLGWFVPEENAKAVRRLLLEEPADLPNNRRTLYVCPECGDIGCGAVTVVVEQLGNKIIWRDFGFENNYDNVIQRMGFGRIGPFTFDHRSYEQTIRRAMKPA
ncbi:MAG TPA: hypothetical protein VJU84_01800 [Pyrinomonadaceae bacterium]|nr:hypothetical protein [Pyrinomonadaceae bacterium]